MKIEYLLTDKSMKVPPNYIKVRIKKIGCFYFGIENDDDEKYRDICLLISTIHKSCAIFSMLLISQNPDKKVICLVEYFLTQIFTTTLSEHILNM